MRLTNLFLLMIVTAVALPVTASGQITKGFWYDPSSTIEVTGGLNSSGGTDCCGSPSAGWYSGWQLFEDALSPTYCDPGNLGSCFGNYLENSDFAGGSDAGACPNPPPSGSADTYVLSTDGYALTANFKCIKFSTGNLNQGGGHASWSDGVVEAAWQCETAKAALVPFVVTEAGYLFIQTSALSATGVGSAACLDPDGSASQATASWSINEPNGLDNFGVCVGLTERDCDACGPSIDQRDPGRPRCIPIPAGSYTFSANFASTAKSAVGNWHVMPPLQEDVVNVDFHFDVTLRYLRNPFRLADVNNNGVVSFGDVNPFVAALQGEDAFYQAYPEGSWDAADINQDGYVDFLDVNPFTACVANGGCP
jgi:hypothetical protein